MNPEKTTPSIVIISIDEFNEIREKLKELQENGRKQLIDAEPTPLPDYTITASDHDKIEKQEERKRLRDSWKKKKLFPRGV